VANITNQWQIMPPQCHNDITRMPQNDEAMPQNATTTMSQNDKSVSQQFHDHCNKMTEMP
jgi:hypothetical protein